MKIIVFSDAHGNFDALVKLSETEDFKTADKRVFLGDAVVMGPFSNECCEFLLKNDCVWILGNHDSYVAHGLPEEEFQYFKPDKIAHQAYVANLVLEKYKTIIKTLPKEYEISLGNKKLYFTHYVWETWNNVVDNPEESNLEDISKIFKDIDADFIVYAHEHHFSHFKDKNKEYVCVGSIGMVYPGHYTLIEIDDMFNVDFQHKTIDFDLRKFKQDILKENYPRAEKYAGFFDENK